MAKRANNEGTYRKRSDGRWEGRATKVNNIFLTTRLYILKRT